ncbi:MAG TPA: hypothetical protein VGG28_07090 [Kofleriaceae bacterium]|jgi:hypothetical protein
MNRAICIALLIAATTATAGPKKPPPLTSAQVAAIKLATAWVDKLGHSAADARAITATKLRSLALTDDRVDCPETTTADAGLPCLHDKVTPKGKAAIWRHTLGGPLAAHQKTIDDLARHATAVVFDEGCDGTETMVIVIVDAKQVIAVFAQTMECSE